MVKCDICEDELTKREEEIYNEISGDMDVCYCSVAKRIATLENCSDKIVNSLKEILPIVLAGYLKNNGGDKNGKTIK